MSDLGSTHTERSPYCVDRGGRRLGDNGAGGGFVRVEL